MDFAWAISLPPNCAASAGKLRHVPGLEVLSKDERVWIRGPAGNEELELLLRALPGAERYSLHLGRDLVLAGSLVPTGRLPTGTWTALEKWLTVELSPAAMAGRLAGRVPLAIERTTDGLSPGNHAVSVLISDATTWAQYAASAPQARLDRWHFAAATDGRVVVRSSPLPPIPGMMYCEEEGVAVPAGFAFSPRLESAVVKELLELQSHDLALFQADGSWERIAAEQFVRATRSAVRASW